MQIRIQNGTLEEHTLHWIKNSALLKPLQDFSQTSLLATKKAFGVFVNKLKFKLSKTKTDYPVGERNLKFQLKRSEEFLQRENQKLLERKEKIANQIQSHQPRQLSQSPRRETLLEPSKKVNSPSNQNSFIRANRNIGINRDIEARRKMRTSKKESSNLKSDKRSTL